MPPWVLPPVRAQGRGRKLCRRAAKGWGRQRPGSIKDIVYNVVSAVEPLATKKKLDFKVDVAPDMPAGHGDEQKLTQVLLNLTGNAIKFTDAGEVAINVAAANGSFSVAIKDTGPGISAACKYRFQG